MPPELQPAYEIRDPIHGLIRLTETEASVVDTRVFQRLRRIRQLALADLVYPGALHTRFEHSLGTFHLACRILTRLAELEQASYNDQQIVRLAGLLHDIGHGPFSHVSEYLLDRLYDKSKVGAAGAREKIHEKITADVIRKDVELAQILTEDQRERVIQVIEGNPRSRDYRHDIVSSALDADKMDYLLRDAHYAGVQYGRYDLEMVLASFRVVRRGSESFLTVGEAAIFAVEQLVQSKYHMTQQVYAHRVRTITDAMIVRGLELAVETNEDLRAAYSYDGSNEHLQRYVGLDDGAVVQAVLSRGNARAASIFGRLRDRRLFKEVALIPIDKERLPDSGVRWQLQNMREEQWKEVEAAVAAKLGCEHWETIVHRKSIKNPAYQRPGSLDPEAIQVEARDGTMKELNDFEELARAELPSTERLHVIAPWDAGAKMQREERRRARVQLDAEIRAEVFEALRRMA